VGNRFRVVRARLEYSTLIASVLLCARVEHAALIRCLYDGQMSFRRRAEARVITSSIVGLRDT
jgi:hypothetical protein